jgi:CRP-like cAMP-binding protein
MITAMTASGLFDGIEPDEREKLRKTLKLQSRYLDVDEVLVDEGEETSVFWLLVSGRLHGARYYRDGGVDLVQFYSAGDVVCLDVVCTRTRKSLLQISCVRPAEVIAVDYDLLTRSRARGAVRNAITRNVTKLLADESLRKQYKIDVLYKKTLRARVRTFLLHMAEKTGKDSFDIGMDREQFAHYIGVNRSALSHELGLMQREGLVSFSKSKFELLPGFDVANSARGGSRES